MKRKPIGSPASDPNDDLNYDPFYSNLPTSLPGVGTTQGGINTAPTLGVRLPNGQTSGRQLPMSGMALPTTPAPTLNPAQPRLGRSIPSIPGQDEMIAPVEATQSASTNGTQKIRDLFSGGLKGLGDFLYNPEQGKQIGNLLAEMGYSMAYRSAGNKDDYYSSWNRGTNLNNANSDYSRNTRDLLAKIDPERTKAMASYDKLSGEEAMGLYDTVFNKERYMDMAKQQSADKYNAVRERIKRQGGGGGSASGSPRLSSADEKLLKVYNEKMTPHESLDQDIKQLMELAGGQNASDIEGLIKNPMGSSTHVNWFSDARTQEKAGKAKALIEAIFAGKRHELFGASLTGNELKSANEMYGKGGWSLNDILNQARRLQEKSQQDRATVGGGYSERVRTARSQNLQNTGGGYGVQSSPTAPTSNDGVIDYTQFKRKK